MDGEGEWKKRENERRGKSLGRRSTAKQKDDTRDDFKLEFPIAFLKLRKITSVKTKIPEIFAVIKYDNVLLCFL